MTVLYRGPCLNAKQAFLGGFGTVYRTTPAGSTKEVHTQIAVRRTADLILLTQVAVKVMSENGIEEKRMMVVSFCGVLGR